LRVCVSVVVVVSMLRVRVSVIKRVGFDNRGKWVRISHHDAVLYFRPSLVIHENNTNRT
jgi:hypothetical protein